MNLLDVGFGEDSLKLSKLRKGQIIMWCISDGYYEGENYTCSNL